MLGLDAGGKTTLLYGMSSLSGDAEVSTSIPTIGFNVETLELHRQQLAFTSWDVGGCDKIRPLWRHYFQNVQAVVFVVDSNDRERFSDARHELHNILSEDQLGKVPLLVVATKQDLPSSSPEAVLVEALDLYCLRARHWKIMSTVATVRRSAADVVDHLQELLVASRDSRKASKPASTKTNATSKPETATTNSIIFRSAEETSDYNQRLRSGTVSSASSGTTLETVSEPDGTTARGLSSPGGGDQLAQLHVNQLRLQVQQQQHEVLIVEDWLHRARAARSSAGSRIISNTSVGAGGGGVTRGGTGDFILIQLANHSLDLWDHFTHVHLAWLLLRRHGLEKGFLEIEHSFQAFIAYSNSPSVVSSSITNKLPTAMHTNADQLHHDVASGIAVNPEDMSKGPVKAAGSGGPTSGRSFHATMTRFWCHMIAYAMALHRQHLHMQHTEEEGAAPGVRVSLHGHQITAEAKSDGVIGMHEYHNVENVVVAKEDDEDDVFVSFMAFLKMAVVSSSPATATPTVASTKVLPHVPALWNKRLFSAWFSNPRLFAQASRAAVRPPDLQTLPDILPLLQQELAGTAVTDGVEVGSMCNIIEGEQLLANRMPLIEYPYDHLLADITFLKSNNYWRQQSEH